MVAPYAESPVTIKLIDRLHSRPYVDITIDAMRQFGVEVENHDYKKFIVKNGQRYSGRYYRVEGDYSSAAYFFAAAAFLSVFLSVFFSSTTFFSTNSSTTISALSPMRGPTLMIRV